MTRSHRLCSALASALVVLLASVAAAPLARADAVRSAQWYLGSLAITKAWSVTKGAGVKVAVIDSGVDGTAQDLRGAVVGGKDFSGKGASNGQQPIATNGGPQHGTAVGALIAGRGHGSGAGIIGAAPAAELLSASIDILSSSDNSAQVAAAVRWSVDAGAGVINLSLTVKPTAALVSALAYAEAKNVVVVAATGDSFVSLQKNGLASPANEPGVVAVSGVDADLKSDPASVIGQGTAIAAPFSTTPADATSGVARTGLALANVSNAAQGPYYSGVGTSFSAPIVAGIAALVRAKFPTMSAANVINRLIRSATPAGGSVPNQTYGYGIVNAYAALTKDVASVSANPLGSLAGGGSSSSGSGSASGTSTPASGSTPAPTSSPAPAASSSSSGLGAGAWIGIVVAVLVVAALIVWLLRRGRTPPPPPPGYGPHAGYGPPPPGYGPPR